MQHARGGAIGERLLRDQLRRKVEIEFRDEHGMSIVWACFRARVRYEFTFNNPRILYDAYAFV